MGWRYRLDVEYDGRGFSGWQRQPGRRTVQGELERVLGTLGEAACPFGAGRTDAGVHALQNVAHADLAREWNPADLRKALSGTSPPDLHVTEVSRVGPEFHARYGATARTYHYALARRDDLFFRGRRWTPRVFPESGWIRREIDGLRGERDVASLARSGSESRTTICRIQDVEWTELEGGALFGITANRFLYGMVRALVGSLIRGFERSELSGWMERLLRVGDRAAAGPSAPAQGLYLTSVRYSEDAEPGDPRPRVARLAGLGPLA